MSSLSARTLADVAVFDMEPHADERGAVSEVYRRAWVPEAREAVQANLSETRAGVLRGLHWHREQRDFWCFLSGRAWAAMVDLRSGSPTYREMMTLSIDTNARRVGISIPPGVAHGFEAETDVTLLYLVDAYYTGTDEFGLAWDDPALAIAWPDREPMLSERDRSNPSLADVLRDAPSYPSG
jgi:dTDP-4-dehydrorhamnose 3,5-epimerase